MPLHHKALLKPIEMDAIFGKLPKLALLHQDFAKQFQRAHAANAIQSSVVGTLRNSLRDLHIYKT